MTELETVLREIPYSGKCYLTCRSYDASDFDLTLRSALENARAHGARELCLGFQDAAHLTMFSLDSADSRFDFYSDFVWMEKRLAAEDGSAYRMKRVNEGNAALFSALYNESFRSVPNAMTMDELTIGEALDGRHEAGFLMNGGAPEGIYELDLSEAVPEIAAIGIRPDLQGAGNGARAMLTLERSLLKRGFSKARLLVATVNRSACALYTKRGFRRTKVLSRWFSVRSEGGGSYPPDRSR